MLLSIVHTQLHVPPWTPSQLTCGLMVHSLDQNAAEKGLLCVACNIYRFWLDL